MLVQGACLLQTGSSISLSVCLHLLQNGSEKHSYHHGNTDNKVWSRRGEFYLETHTEMGVALGTK